jgi:cell division protein FtsI (penicillin-binding protein 3)
MLRSPEQKENNASKILAIFALISLAFIIFFSGITFVSNSSKNQTNLVGHKEVKPLRGIIYSDDGKILAQSKEEYYFALNGAHIDSKHYDFLSEQIAIFTGLKRNYVLKKLNLKKRTLLLKNMDHKMAQALKRLSHSFDKMRLFNERKVRGVTIRQGFEIAKRPTLRRYPYGDLATPMLGFFNKSKRTGVMGIERSFESALASGEVKKSVAQKDVGGNLIFDSSNIDFEHSNGENIVLNINAKLQGKIEKVCDSYKKELDAKEILVAVMESKTGKIRALASSNRYNPERIKNVAYTNMNFIQYPFEPGSVMKPFLMAHLIETGEVTPYDLLWAEKGRFRIGKKTITDTHPHGWISMEDIIVESSNIGVAKLAQKLTPYTYLEMLQMYDLHEKSYLELPYEYQSSLPSMGQLKASIVKATLAYGYGLKVNMMQLIKAFNIFNNEGKMLTPRLIKNVGESAKLEVPDMEESIQVLSAVTSKKMLKILRKTVREGTGKGAFIPGVFTAGKTGTAHVARKGKYQKLYHSSFLGFANDNNSRYTLGVLVIHPKNRYFASQTAVPVFKESVLALNMLGWLNKKSSKK